MDGLSKQIGKRIKLFRAKKGWTQEELAFEADLHRAYVGQIERGEKIIGVKNLQKIAKTLNVKMSKLLGE